MRSIWLHTLKEAGFKQVSSFDFTKEQKRKSRYVEKYLNPSVAYGRTGWDHIVYTIFQNDRGHKEEYILICPNSNNNEGARCVNVSANSLSAIAQTVWNNID